jgi:hypothetical protein
MLLIPLPAFCSCAVCPQGLIVAWGYVADRVVTSAYAESGIVNEPHTLEFWGSFVARVTGDHYFRMWSHTYGVSSLKKATAKLTWDNSAEYLPDEGNKEWFQTFVLNRDFRYALLFTVQEPYVSVKISIAAEFEGQPMEDLAGDLIGQCQQSGCRDDLYGRQPYLCQPSPSVSRSPTVTRSLTRCRTRSTSPSPTSSTSPSRVFGTSAAFDSRPFIRSKQVVSGQIAFSEKAEVTPGYNTSLELAAPSAWRLESRIDDSKRLFETGRANRSTSVCLSADFGASLGFVGSVLLISARVSRVTNFLNASIEAAANTLIVNSLFVPSSGIGISADISATASFLKSNMAVPADKRAMSDGMIIGISTGASIVAALLAVAVVVILRNRIRGFPESSGDIRPQQALELDSISGSSSEQFHFVEPLSAVLSEPVVSTLADSLYGAIRTETTTDDPVWI